MEPLRDLYYHKLVDGKWSDRVMFASRALRQRQVGALPVLVADLQTRRLAHPTPAEHRSHQCSTAFRAAAKVLKYAFLIWIAATIANIVVGIVLFLVVAIPFSIFGDGIRGDGFRWLVFTYGVLVSLLTAGVAAVWGWGLWRRLAHHFVFRSVPIWTPRAVMSRVMILHGMAFVGITAVPFFWLLTLGVVSFMWLVLEFVRYGCYVIALSAGFFDQFLRQYDGAMNYDSGGSCRLVDGGPVPPPLFRRLAVAAIRAVTAEHASIDYICEVCCVHLEPWRDPKINVTYLRCRGCHRVFDGSWVRDDVDSLVGVLDSSWSARQHLVGRTLYVNWSHLRAPCDLDCVEIRKATEEEIERLVIGVRNDVDSRRFKRNRAAPCVVAAQCRLSRQTKRQLEATFASVSYSPPRGEPCREDALTGTRRKKGSSCDTP